MIDTSGNGCKLRTFATPDSTAGLAPFQQQRAADYHQEPRRHPRRYRVQPGQLRGAVHRVRAVPERALPLSWARAHAALVAAFMIYGEPTSTRTMRRSSRRRSKASSTASTRCDIPKQNATDAPLAPADFGIEMNGASFGYDADRRVIDDVSLRILQGTS